MNSVIGKLSFEIFLMEDFFIGLQMYLTILG